MQGSQLLEAAVEIGTLMLSHGAEIHRVEDTVCRITAAYGSSADVFAIPNSLVVTVTHPDGSAGTLTRRIYRRDTNLARVDRLNALARQICATLPNADQIAAQIADIKRDRLYTTAQQVAAGGLVAGAFALLFDGSLPEGLIALGFGLLVKSSSIFFDRVQAGPLLANIICGAFAGLLSVMASVAVLGVRADVLIISLIMLLAPGLSITNSMRDLIAGDLVTGVMKITEALLIAAGISIGVALSLSLWRAVTGVMLL